MPTASIRLARNILHLQQLVEGESAYRLFSRKERMMFDARTAEPMQRFMSQLPGAVVEFKRTQIRER